MPPQRSQPVSLDFGRSILILAPHPDDEVVACCAAIGQARAAGAAVRVIFLTHGCLARETMWPWARDSYDAVVARRRAEAEAVLAELGVEAAGWSDLPARELWRRLPEAEAEVRATMAGFDVDQVWAPAFEGGNADHDGASALAARLADDGVSVLEFAEYNLAGGRAHSHAFPAPNGTERVLTLSPAEQAAKRRALAGYASERGNLGYVGVAREVMRPLPAYDYAAAPHAGKLWYARFQWVPFRHPGVDFTQPDEVARTLAAYRSSPSGPPLTPG
jgi:LmbE family N-acetylglucosaminyl deacetylase